VSSVERPGQPRLEMLAGGLIYAAFGATGMGVVLPGTLLSVLLTRWSLTDEQAGLLFFVFFVGSSCGALLSRGRLHLSIARGCFCVALGAVALAVSSQVAAFFAMTFFGLGLGLAMTSLSLLQSRRRPVTRTAEMARLNMIWAIGAFISPTLLLRSAVRWSLPAVLCAVALCFAVLGTAALLLLARTQGDGQVPVASSKLSGIRSMPFALLAVVPLATGIESSVGGWLEAYSKRSGLLLVATISTVTCFWAGLLLSRLIQSQRTLATATQELVLKVSPWLMSLALLLIIVRPQGGYILAGALLLGLAIGPVYPLVLSLLLEYGEAGNVMFLAGGIGASALPLFTGLVSGWTRSLASGLSVPLAGSVMMGIFAIAYRKTQKVTCRS
jgi:FHS family glucose/mannose:H+ symporter-like MFS transporter